MNNGIKKIYIKAKHENIVALALSKMKKIFQRKENIRIQELENQVESLYKLLSLSIDITQLRPIGGDLRNIQKADTTLLEIFHKICIENNLRYWIDYGTLLGAIRHNGFIPWDDDVDVSMIRDDYDRLKEILEEKLGPFGLEVNCGIGYNAQVLRLILPGTPIQLDVFPYDSYDKKIENKDEEERLISNIKDANKLFFNNTLFEELYYGEKEFPKKYLDKLVAGLQSGIGNKGSAFFSGPEIMIYGTFQVRNYDDIFPLRTITFEGIQVYAPHHIDYHLTRIYGNYMDFPKFKILGHANINKTKCVDLKQSMALLNSVNESIKSGEMYD